VTLSWKSRLRSRAKCPNPWQLWHCFGFSIGMVKQDKQYSILTPNLITWPKSSSDLDLSTNKLCEFGITKAHFTLHLFKKDGNLRNAVQGIHF
jgi:hypothetical protein